MTYVLGETWDQGPANYDIYFAREFRYDSARQRYMNRALDPNALEGGSRVLLSVVWSDYHSEGESTVISRSTARAKVMPAHSAWVWAGSTGPEVNVTKGKPSTTTRT